MTLLAPYKRTRLVRKENRNTFHLGFLITHRGKSQAETHCKQSGWRGEWREFLLDPREIYAPQQLCRKCFYGAPPRLPPPVPGDRYDELLRAAYYGEGKDGWLILADWLEEQGCPSCEAVRELCLKQTGAWSCSARTMNDMRVPSRLLWEFANHIRDLRLLPTSDVVKPEFRACYTNYDKGISVAIVQPVKRLN